MNPRLSFATTLLFLAALVLVTFAPRRADATSFQVSPVRVHLTSQETSELLTLSNTSDRVIRVSLEAFAWAESAAGEMELSPTSAVIVFPAIVALEPGESRKIRVGVTERAAEVERSYRVFIEELPPLRTERRPASGVHVLTRVGIPIFLRPAAPAPKPAIERLRLEGSTLAFSLHNAGSAHFIARRIHVIATKRDGERAFERELSGWYVLAGGTRDYRLPLPEEACAATSLELRVDTGEDVEVAHVRSNRPLCEP